MTCARATCAEQAARSPQGSLFGELENVAQGRQRALCADESCERGQLGSIRRLQALAMTSVVGDPAVLRALVCVERDGEFARVTMDAPERRNALSLEHMRQLLAAVREVGASDARGLLISRARG